MKEIIRSVKFSKNDLLKICLIIVVLLGSVLILRNFLFRKSTVNEAWVSTGWDYKRTITVTGSGSVLTDEDILVTIDTASLINQGKLQSNCNDLRFVDSDNSTLLNFWIEGGCNSSTTNIWVRIPSLPSGGKTIYMYYGNSSASSVELSWGSNKDLMLVTSSCPTGWTKETLFNGRFILGSSQYGNTGGSNTHNHGGSVLTLSGTSSRIQRPITLCTGTSGSCVYGFTGYAQEANSAPEYLTVNVCSRTKIEGIAGGIFLSDNSTPSGWTAVSSLNNRFPYGSTSATGGTTGGSATHTHTFSTSSSGLTNPGTLTARGIENSTPVVLTNFPVTDGDIKVITLSSDEGTAYIGGSFTTVYTTNEGSLVGVSTSTGTPVNTGCAVVNGLINASVSDGSGGVYIGGAFNVNGSTISNLAHISSNCTLDTNFNVSVNASISVMAFSGTILYIGGDFTVVGGVSRNKLASITVATKTVNSFNPSPNNAVTAILLSGSTLYVGGAFTSIGGQSRNYVAAVNSSTGTATSFNANANSYVFSFLLSGTTLYVGGAFTTMGGTTRNRVAAVNSSTGALITGFNANANSTVFAMALSGTNLYLGGVFTTIGGTTRNRVAAVNSSTGALVTGFNANVGGAVYALYINGTSLYIGGQFTTIGGTRRNNMGAVNYSTGSLLTFNPNVSGKVMTFALYSTTLYIGGEFAAIGGQSRNRIAAISTSTGALTSFNPNANDIVDAIVVSGSTIYVGGYFTTIGGQSRNRIAALSASTGSATSFNPNCNGTVMALVLNGSTLYVGGSFTTIGGQSRTNIASLNASTGSANSFNPGVTGGAVGSIELVGSTLYIGGWFTAVVGEERKYIAALDTSGNLKSFNPSADNYVFDLASYGGILYVGGAFTVLDWYTRNKLASFDTYDDYLLPFDPEPNGNVYSLYATDGILYVGGLFSTIGGVTRNRIASFNTSDDTIRSFDGSAAGGAVNVLLGSGSYLYAGGYFSSLSGITRNYFGVFSLANEGKITSIGSDGVGASNLPPSVKMIYALAPSGINVLNNQVISMFTSIPPLGWTQYSTLNNLYAMGSSSVDLTVQGSSSHTHGITYDFTQSSDGLGTFVNWSLANNTSNPNLEVFANSQPAYATVVYGKRKVSKSISIGSEVWLNTVPNPPSSLLCENQTNPTDVTNVTPSLSAVFSDPDSDNTGTYYQIQVNTSSSFNGTVMWDSGKTISSPSITNGNRSSNITYSGTALTQNGATYYWRIKFWDNKGGESNWSSAAQFTMYNNTPPNFTSILNNSPINPGGTVIYTSSASDPSSRQVKLAVCKTSGVTGTSCSGETLCESSFVNSNPSCSFTIDSIKKSGAYSAYVYVFNSAGIPAISALQGSLYGYSVNNVAPVISNVILNGGNAITLTEGTNTSIGVTATITDGNSCTDISTVTAFLYRSGIGYGGCDTTQEGNSNYCYPQITCYVVGGTCSGDTDSSASYNCSFSMAYFSDPTDVNSQYPSELWLSTVKAIDIGSLYGLGETSSGVELNSLLAFDVTNSIHYGSLEAGQHNENLDRETTITSRGNVGLTQELSGSSLCADYPTCSPNLQIFVNNQRYSANSSTPYTSGNTLTFDPTITNIYMPKPTSSTPVTANIWWGLGVPIGTVSGAYNGELVVTGIKSSPDKW